MTEQGTPLWSGRSTARPAEEASRLGRSLAFDVRLAPQDVEVSMVHVRALEEAGLLSEEEAGALEKALREVGDEIAAGTLAFDPADEDVHSAIERATIARLGDLGARLHAGRSRNDVVMTDLRLWSLAARDRIEAAIVRLARALTLQARAHTASVVPGTTHGRLAQPVTFGHVLLAHAWPLTRDLERIDGWAGRAAVSPLGAGALATSTLGLDAGATATRLGFERAFENSIDAVSDRDVVQELLAVLAICGTHLSRLAADLLLWSDGSRGWLIIDDAYTTGSSMMPQKRNPDVAELARGKAARLLGDFATVTAMLDGLPLGYHRDFQEDKEPTFDAVDTVEVVLAALAGCLETMRADVQVMRAAASSPELYATDVAEALVRVGVSFRDAHHRIGELLRSLDTDGRTLADLSGAEWRELGLPDGAELLDPDRSVLARSGPGGPSPASVEDQCERIDRLLSARLG
jgi:argininosuccinate lyase